MSPTSYRAAPPRVSEVEQYIKAVQLRQTLFKVPTHMSEAVFGLTTRRCIYATQVYNRQSPLIEK